MNQRFELFAAGPAAPDRLWGLVGDPRRLPEWTDADRVDDVAPEPVQVGTSFVTRDGGRRLEWRVETLEQRLIEVGTGLTHGRLAVGARVVRDPTGARLVLAAGYEPASRAAAWRFRLAGGPALRRRFDAWAHRALQVAAGEPG